MWTLKLFSALFFLCNLQGLANAQSDSARFAPIFEDLPIDDPEKNSKINRNETAEEKIRKNIFVTASLTKSKCYIGEPILITYKLYSALQSSSGIKKRPSFLGFVVSEFDADNEIPEYQKLNGKNYRTFTMLQLQLISMKEGPVDIDPVVVENIIQYKKDNGQSDQYAGSVSGEPLTVIVEPLPAKGKSVGSSSIGQFTVSTAVKSTTFAASENNVLEIKIAGTGNFANFLLPDIDWPTGIEHYSSGEQTDVRANKFPPAGVKIFSIPFTAKPGFYTIPPVSVAFFDPVKKSYIITQSEMLKMNVLPAVQMPKQHI